MKHINTSNKKGADLSEIYGRLRANINKMLGNSDLICCELIRLKFVDILHGE